MRPVPALLFMTAASLVGAAVTFIVMQRKQNLGYAERIPGGKAASMHPWEFDPKQFVRGMKVEMEHVQPDDWCSAGEIAMDHLVEDKRYYHKLATIHTD